MRKVTLGSRNKRKMSQTQHKSASGSCRKPIIFPTGKFREKCRNYSKMHISRISDFSILVFWSSKNVSMTWRVDDCADVSMTVVKRWCVDVLMLTSPTSDWETTFDDRSLKKNRWAEEKSAPIFFAKLKDFFSREKQCFLAFCQLMIPPARSFSCFSESYENGDLQARLKVKSGENPDWMSRHSRFGVTLTSEDHAHRHYCHHRAYINWHICDLKKRDIVKHGLFTGILFLSFVNKDRPLLLVSPLGIITFRYVHQLPFLEMSHALVETKESTVGRRDVRMRTVTLLDLLRWDYPDDSDDLTAAPFWHKDCNRIPSLHTLYIATTCSCCELDFSRWPTGRRP